MGERVGIIAGAGSFPYFLAKLLRREGRKLYILAVEGKVEAKMLALAQSWKALEPTELGAMLCFFQNNGIKEVYLAGKVDPAWLMKSSKFDFQARRLWTKLPEKTIAAVIERLIDFLGQQGIAVLDPGPFLQPFFCQPGSLTSHQVSAETLADLELAFRLALRMADLEIGQVVAVKKGIIVAVEALEGTDEMIKRAGELAGSGIAVAKVGRREQKTTVDVPAIGLETIRSLVAAKATCLAIEAGKVAFFEREEALKLAQEAGLALVVKLGIN